MKSIWVLRAVCASYGVVGVRNAAKNFRDVRNLEAARKKTVVGDNNRLQAKSDTLAGVLMIMLGITVAIPGDISAQQSLTKAIPSPSPSKIQEILVTESNIF